MSNSYNGHAHEWGSTFMLMNDNATCSLAWMSRACSLMNERDNAMLNANIHEYYMNVTWMSMYVSNIHECYINEHVWPYQH